MFIISLTYLLTCNPRVFISKRQRHTLT